MDVVRQLIQPVYPLGVHRCFFAFFVESREKVCYTYASLEKDGMDL